MFELNSKGIREYTGELKKLGGGRAQISYWKLPWIHCVDQGQRYTEIRKLLP
jgi:hypothetical protein